MLVFVVVPRVVLPGGVNSPILGIHRFQGSGGDPLLVVGCGVGGWGALGTCSHMHTMYAHNVCQCAYMLLLCFEFAPLVAMVSDQDVQAHIVWVQRAS